MKVKQNFKKTMPEKEETNYESAYDRVIFEEIIDESDSHVTSLAKALMDGQPLVLNFSALDIDAANKVIAFLSGVVFALEGEIIQIQDKVFMFARKQDFMDGTLQEFIDHVSK